MPSQRIGTLPKCTEKYNCVAHKTTYDYNKIYLMMYECRTDQQENWWLYPIFLVYFLEMTP